MKKYRLKGDPGRYEVTGEPVAATSEGDPTDGEGRHLRGSTHSGGWIESSVDREGAFFAKLQGPIERGRNGEAHALKLLLQRLSEDGWEAVEVPGARDGYGEDRLVEFAGRTWVVQMVTVPAEPEVWRRLASGEASLEGDRDKAVEYLRQGILKKEHVEQQVILVLDASVLGAAVTQDLVQAYLRSHGDPEGEFGLAQVWLIGRTVRSSFRLGARSGPRPTA